MWRAVLARPDAARRPDPTTWSPLEYGCHVRDVCDLYTERLGLLRGHDDPLFANWDQDQTAVALRYDLADPAVVADEVAQAAERMAAALDAVGTDQWGRPGRRSDGVAFTIDSFARYFLHDIVHHLHDVARPSGGVTG